MFFLLAFVVVFVFALLVFAFRFVFAFTFAQSTDGLSSRYQRLVLCAMLLVLRKMGKIRSRS